MTRRRPPWPERLSDQELEDALRKLFTDEPGAELAVMPTGLLAELAEVARRIHHKEVTGTPTGP
jgi:hypothetical protein